MVTLTVIVYKIYCCIILQIAGRNLNELPLVFRDMGIILWSVCNCQPPAHKPDDSKETGNIKS